jgi:voltage-gated potassium channel
VLVLQFESNSSESKILNGWDAFWYSMVTITTVGYGDYYPVTFGGRVTAMFIMVAGIGIIGALASILASVLVGGGEEPETAAAAPDPEGLDSELRALRAEVAEMKVMLERLAPPGHAGT